MSIKDLAQSIYQNVQNNLGINTGGAQTGTSEAQRGWTDSSGSNVDWYNNDYYDYGGGGGYGGGGKSAEEVQAENQAQIRNTAGNYGKRGGDMSRLGQDSLNNIRDQIQQNLALYKQNRRNNMKQIEWQPQQQKEQSTTMSLRDRMNNASYGSALTDLAEGLARIDDMADVQLINAWKQTENATRNDWLQADDDLISDYIDQRVAIEDEFSKLYSQYWSAISNINPQLASEGNISSSANGGSASFGEGTDYYELPSASGILPSQALRALFANPTRASAVNPYTKDFVRPERSGVVSKAIQDSGVVNRGSAANNAFYDNLDLYKRRV